MKNNLSTREWNLGSRTWGTYRVFYKTPTYTSETVVDAWDEGDASRRLYSLFPEATLVTSVRKIDKR